MCLLTRLWNALPDLVKFSSTVLIYKNRLLDSLKNSYCNTSLLHLMKEMLIAWCLDELPGLVREKSYNKKGLILEGMA